VVWHVRDFLSRRRLMARALRPAARRVAGAIAISRAVALDARPLLGRTPVRVVHNAVDTDVFSPGAGTPEWLDRCASMDQAPPGTVRIGLVATFARWKGHLLFLEAASRVLAVHPAAPVRFYIVGGPIYATAGSQHDEANLRREASRLGLEGRAGFTGFQADVAQVYRSLDIVVHASTEPEPFGRTIVEAMGCGRAVIASREGGAAELFTDGEDALGFGPGDAAGLARLMARLSDDPALRRRLEQRARHTAETRFSRARLGPEVLAAYEAFNASGPEP
jgi:glycosyltransferase involved in cell wall biosynthesis